MSCISQKWTIHQLDQQQGWRYGVWEGGIQHVRCGDIKETVRGRGGRGWCAVSVASILCKCMCSMASVLCSVGGHGRMSLCQKYIHVT